MSSPSPLYLCVTTVSTSDEAETLASKAIESELAACAQVDAAVTSFYRWQGKVEKDPECRISFYAIETNVKPLEDFVHQHHPYDTPKWVVFAAEKVSEKYLKWANEVSNLRGFI